MSKEMTNGSEKNECKHAKEEEGENEMMISKHTEQIDSRKDTGWAWMILAGTFLHVFLFVGIGKSFGLFFIEFLKIYNTNSSMLSGIISAQNLVISVSSIFVLNVGTKKTGTRKMIIFGGLVCFVSFLLNAYVPGIAVLIIAQSILYGIGVSCVTGPVFVMLNQYFEVKLGFASMIASSGGSIGGLLMPLIIQGLIDEYGLSGTLLVVSGMLLNNVIVGAISRPFTAAHSLSVNGEISKVFENNDKGENRKDTSSSDANVKCGLSFSVNNISSYYEPEQNGNSRNGYSTYRKMIQSRKRSLSESCSATYYSHSSSPQNVASKSFMNFLNKISESTSNIYAGVGVKGKVCSIYNLKERTEGQKKCDPEVQMEQCCCNKIFDCDILKNRHLQLILFVCLVSVVGCGMIVIYIPPFAQDFNVPSDKIAILVIIMGACDLLARFGLAWISDSKFVRRSHILGICLAITGIVTMLNPLYTNFESFTVYAVVYGLFGSVYFSISPLLLRESVGAEKYPAALSLLIVIHGIGFTVLTPLLGLARDLTGSYTLSFYIMGAGTLIGAVAIFCEPIFKRMENKRIERDGIT